MDKYFQYARAEFRGGSDGWDEGLAGSILTTEFFGVTISGGKLKYWDGVSWSYATLKRWTGTAWQTTPLRYWNGTSWVLTN